jgi:hypothetical protein
MFLGDGAVPREVQQNVRRFDVPAHKKILNWQSKLQNNMLFSADP